MNQALRIFPAAAAALALLAACSPPVTYDVIVRGGTIYDGSGGTPFVADVAIDDDVIVAIGDLDDARASSTCCHGRMNR
jgi:N-acyl-D-amino-acid deacylase